MPEFRHFLLSDHGVPDRYKATGGGGGKFKTPPRDNREAHGKSLLAQLSKVQTQAADLEKDPASAGLHFIPVSFQGELIGAGKDLSGLRLESLENTDGTIRIINVREEGSRQFALVAIAKGKFEHFATRFEQYVNEDRVKTDKNTGEKIAVPKHKALVESISELRLAAIRDYYTDVDNAPPAPQEVIWWEVWLEANDLGAAEQWFRAAAQQISIQLSGHSVRFPEAVVVLARTSLGGFAQVPGLLNYLAELRRAKIVATEFVDLGPSDQSEFIQDLLDRLTYAGEDAPAVCILDTGVNRGHPLLEQALSEADTQAWRPDWSPADLQGHGTELAGITLFGDRLGHLLLESAELVLRHRLESVKILPDGGANQPPDYGPITVGSMAKAELAAPNRARVFCLAITADDRDAWRPTLWSSALDQATAGGLDDHRRLVCVSAGNILQGIGERYPDDNHLSSVQDPAQCWNGLTVGAHTDLVWVETEAFRGWKIVAPKGRLAPASTTSIAWDEQEWPIKPEIVLEGGNYLKDRDGVVNSADDLSLLTTRLSEAGALLGTTRDTSPAAAQAAYMAAAIQAEYPALWPESVRGLLVHTANWTSEMCEEFPREKTRNGFKKIPAARLRCYGWGVPSLEEALRCARNVATMIVQDSLQPFRMDENGKVVTNEMKIHALPLPKELLLSLGTEDVRMRVTLSYFIEPSPGRKGWNVSHRYASHGLRFDVIRPTESLEQFKQHISREFWGGSSNDPNEKQRPAKRHSENRGWVMGEYAQTHGSIHSDWWHGSASQLASSQFIAVFPVTGWWRERPQHGCYQKTARYSLIATIKTAKTEIELYNAVAAVIAAEVQVENPIVTATGE
jgi:subtilisin family serine protease